MRPWPRGAPTVTKLSFVDSTPLYDHGLENIVFQAFDGRQRVRCAIAAQALQDHFGAQGRSQQQLIAAFQRGRRKIQLAALRRYAALGQSAAELVLASRDFETANQFSLAKHFRLQTKESQG